MRLQTLNPQKYQPKNLAQDIGDGLGQGFVAVGDVTIGVIGGAGSIVNGVGKEVGALGETTFKAVGDGAHGIGSVVLGKNIADGVKHNVDQVACSFLTRCLLSVSTG